MAINIDWPIDGHSPIALCVDTNAHRKYARGTFVAVPETAVVRSTAYLLEFRGFDGNLYTSQLTTLRIVSRGHLDEDIPGLCDPGEISYPWRESVQRIAKLSHTIVHGDIQAEPVTTSVYLNAVIDPDWPAPNMPTWHAAERAVTWDMDKDAALWAWATQLYEQHSERESYKAQIARLKRQLERQVPAAIASALEATESSAFNAPDARMALATMMREAFPDAPEPGRESTALMYLRVEAQGIEMVAPGGFAEELAREQYGGGEMRAKRTRE